jgi:MYXO-CTERM domain-containing protein
VVSYYFKAKWAYGFEVCKNEALLPESFSRSKSVAFNGQVTTGSGGASGVGGGNPSGSGSSSSGSGAGGSGNGAGGSGSEVGAGGDASSSGGTGDEGSCSCSTPGVSSDGAAAAALGLFGLAAFFGRLIRRRR